MPPTLPTVRRKQALVASIVIVVLALLGSLLAAGISAELGISASGKDVPTEQPRVAAAGPAVAPPRFTQVEAPSGLRTRTAVDELRAAVDSAGTTEGSATLTVRHGSGEPDDDSYRLSGTPERLRIEAASETGGVRGIYDLALAAREGRPLTEHLGETVTSRLPFRMVDLGAAGVTADPAQWRTGTDYSHSSKAFENVLLDDAPYVDGAALARAKQEVDAYIEHAVAEGYNAVAVPGFLEYVTFDEVGDGHAVYPAGDPHVARAKVMRETFGPVWQHAHDLGMKVYLRTDMLALTTPLERYLSDEFGLDTENPELWDVYASGLDELYREMPYVEGVVLRIGEAGTVYNLPGWDYYSDLAVTSVTSVRTMLTAFTQQAEAADRTVIFRTWSVGVGAVGDMHTNPDSYHAVLDGIDSDHLVVSTKYTLGDFYSHLPLNATLETGSQRRIVEFQSRREFEAYGALPNDLGDLYRTALQRFIAANPRVEGIWTWTQDGGPWRAGPMTLELKHGFWQLYELNTVLAARLARDPDADPARMTADWARRWFSTDPATVHAITSAMALSRDAVTHGLYIGPYADQQVKALGLEPPPMMWIFEWDILTGDSAVLDIIYSVSRDELEQAISEGDDAVATALRMRELVRGSDAATWRDPALRAALVDTLDYEVNTLEMLAAYRAMVLRHGQWLDTGSDEARAAWAEARDRFDAAALSHERRYGGNVDLPAYNLAAARLGEERAGLDLPMAWAARVALLLVMTWLFLGALGRVQSARALWVAGTRPWRAGEQVVGLDRRGKTLLVAVPGLALVVSRGIFTWFLAPAHFLVTGLGWLVLAGFVWLATRRVSPWPVVAAVGGAVLLRVLLLLAVLAVRGPGGYWFAFWTEPAQRTAYVVVSFVLFGWVLAAAAWALADQSGGLRMAAFTLGVIGGSLTAVGLLLAVVGLEDALTVWNDQLALLPWGLSRILGITTYLGIPVALPAWLAGAGGVVCAAAAGLWLLGRRPAPS